MCGLLMSRHFFDSNEHLYLWTRTLLNHNDRATYCPTTAGRRIYTYEKEGMAQAFQEGTSDRDY